MSHPLFTPAYLRLTGDDIAGFDAPQSLAQPFAGMPQQLEGIGRRIRADTGIEVRAVFFDQMGLQGRGYFVRRLQSLADRLLALVVICHS